MSALVVLDAARAAGVVIEAEGEDLALEAPSEPPVPLLDSIRRHKGALLHILRKRAARIPYFPAIGQSCANCRGQWWWVRVDRQAREIGGWCCGACVPPPRVRSYDPRDPDWRWTWSGQEGELIPLRPDMVTARAKTRDAVELPVAERAAAETGGLSGPAMFVPSSTIAEVRHEI
jgi:hypothetical protein